jgi:hypothetical protein
MGIVNRRNAVLGWATWQIAKSVAARKAKAAVPGVNEKRRPNKAAIAAVLAGVGAAVVFWRKKSDLEPPSAE